MPGCGTRFRSTPSSRLAEVSGTGGALRVSTVSREGQRGGPARSRIWRGYRHLLPVPTTGRRPPEHRTRIPAWFGPTVAKALGVKRLCVKDDTGNPTPLVQGTGGRGRTAARWELGLKVLAARQRQPPSQRGDAQKHEPALAVGGVIPSSLERRRCSPRPCTRRGDRGRRQLRRRNAWTPSGTGTTRTGRSLNVNVQPLIRGGLQDPRLRGVNSPRLAAARPARDTGRRRRRK